MIQEEEGEALWVMSCVLSLWAPVDAAPIPHLVPLVQPPVQADMYFHAPHMDDVAVLYSTMRGVGTATTAALPQQRASARVLALAQVLQWGLQSRMRCEQKLRAEEEEIYICSSRLGQIKMDDRHSGKQDCILPSTQQPCQ
jgi:hypothetical protein